MAAFAAFNDRLPDPTFGVNDAGGVEAGGKRGPGFANITVSSNRPTQVSRTNSGRGVHRETGSHTWEVNINYHPMLRDQFDIVQSFLDARNGRMNPFFVVLPQYSKPRDPAFNTYVTANTMKPSTLTYAGVDEMMIEGPNNITGTPKPGDLFNVYDPSDINHLKTYKVTGVETNTTYRTGSVVPSVKQVRIHFTPPLTRTVAAQASIVWVNPKIRVIQKSDVLEYQLNTDNLYQFSLSLEEILP